MMPWNWRLGEALFPGNLEPGEKQDTKARSLRRDWGDADVEDHTSLGPTVAQRLEDVWSMSFEKISSLQLVIVVGETMEDYSCKRRWDFSNFCGVFFPSRATEESVSLQAVGQMCCYFVIVAVLFQSKSSTKLPGHSWQLFHPSASSWLACRLGRGCVKLTKLKELETPAIIYDSRLYELIAACNLASQFRSNARPKCFVAWAIR